MRRLINRAITAICRWLDRCELPSLLRAEEIRQTELIDARMHAVNRMRLSESDAAYWERILEEIDGELSATNFFVEHMRRQRDQLRLPAPTRPIEDL